MIVHIFAEKNKKRQRHTHIRAHTIRQYADEPIEDVQTGEKIKKCSL